MTLSFKNFLLAMALLTGVASAQVATGTPPFGSFGGGPFDTVNLGNLNVHFAIPVVHKAGRGIPFTYDLSYDSSIWTPVPSSGTTQWQPVSNWGWRGQTEAATGYISVSVAVLICYSGPHDPTGDRFTYSNWVYHDAFGATHVFPGSSELENGTCGSTITDMNSAATDGSGYTLTTTNANENSTIISRGRKIVIPPYTSTTGAATGTDANGNEITVNSSGQFFDTLSSTTPVLTVSSAAPPAATTFTYTAPSGASAAYSMDYTQYTVKTDFLVTGVSEYGPLSNALVSSITLPDGGTYTVTYEKTPGSCTPLAGTYQTNCVTGRIASVTLATGGTIQYAYSGGSSGIESDGSTAGLTRTLNPGGEWQYARSLSGSTWTTTVTDPNQNQTVINFAEDGNTTAPTYNFYETQRKVNQLINGTQTLLATVIRCYNAVYASCATAAVSSPITQTDVYNELPNGGNRLSEVLYNSHGLVTDDKEYNYGVTMGSAPGQTDLVRETATSYASLGNGIVNKPSSVTVYDWTSGTKTTIASTTYSYDQTTPTATSGTPQHVSITGSRGNLTTLTTATSSTASLSRTFTYYDTGNPNVAKDVNGAQTTYVYSSAANPYNSSLTASCGNSFATTINEPQSLSRSIQWNCIGGIAEQVTDENGQIVKSGYTDPDFWRPANVYDQENNETTITYIGETAAEAALQNFNSGKSASDSRTTVDGFGRIIFNQRKQGPTATDYDTTEVDYNNMGQPYRSTMPYSAAASPSSDNTTAPATQTTYDALGRVLTVTDADSGKVSYTYTNNDVLQQVSGTQTFQKQLEYDGLGRLTSVCEISSVLPGVGTCGQTKTQTGYWTKYTYDALGHLLTVTQNAQAASGSQQQRSFVYDMLGRMTSETNPESGTSTYQYDSVPSPGVCDGWTSEPGDLMQVNRANGSSVCYVHNDGFHRLTRTCGTSGTCQAFRYDNSAGVTGTRPTGITVNNSLGRMVEAETDNGTAWPPTTASIITDEWFSYSPRGEITDVYELTPHSSGYYHTTAAYWPTGALETLSGIPGVPAINYGASGAGLDGEGRVTQVTAASGTNPVTGVTYSTSSTTNPLGAVTGVTFGSADSDSFSYDPNTGRMTGYTFSVNGNTDAGVLTWNTNGTLNQLAITDHIPGTSDTQTCNYLYDDLQRLSSSNCGVLWTQNFTYDAFGNITKNVPTGDNGLTFLPTYSTSPPTNQFTALPGITPKYDASGNLLTDNLNTYTWEAYGHMSTASTGSATVTATYDALGRMVENNAGGTYAEFIYGPTGAKLAKANGTTLVKAFVALPGGAKAVYNSTGLAYYRHSDWLGSSRLTSTATKPTSMYSSTAYAPFGEVQQNQTSGSADASFTGQDQDTLSSLYDFPARRQSPSQGRWISPDPAGLGAVSLANPQSWNRYAYVNNNPLALTDPAGLSTRRHRAHGMKDPVDPIAKEPTDDNDDDDDDDDDDDSSGGCTTTTGSDGSTNVNCTAPPAPPCLFIVGGVGDSVGSLSVPGAIVADPLGMTVVGGYNDIGTLALGIASVAGQAQSGPNQSTDYLQSEYANVMSQNSNVIVVAYSGGAGTFNTMIANTSLPLPAGVIYISPSSPGGFPSLGQTPNMTFNGNAGLNPVVQATNINGEPPVNSNGIEGCEHDFGCLGTNGVLQGIQSDCTGNGNDATGGSPNVGELVGPGEQGSDPLLTTEEEQGKTVPAEVSVAWGGTSPTGREGTASYWLGVAGSDQNSE
jgi:RHS repeat-associated protein